MPIIYMKGDATLDSDAALICHACNCKGCWGSGIALTLRLRYPEAYNAELHRYKTVGLKPGTSAIYETNNPSIKILCLYTSWSYGPYKDNMHKILINTTKALNDLCIPKGTIVASPKFNSGLFGVPWGKTLAILQPFVDKHDLEWRVYTL